MTITIPWSARTFRQWLDAAWCWPDLERWVFAVTERYWCGPRMPPAPYDRRDVAVAVYTGRAIGCWTARVAYPFALREAG